jgi:hypothetical protein
MKVTCCYCGITEAYDPEFHKIDLEGFYWHRKCRDEYLDCIDKLLQRAKEQH